MTREEAKEILSRPFNMKNVPQDILEAHRMAIEALGQESCNDAIDRAEAMTEIMMFAGNVKSDEEDIYIKVSDAVQLLRELPSVKQKTETVTEFADICRECGMEKVLDKIRAEIEALIDWHDCPIEYDNGNDAWYCEACNQTIKIIDKYRAVNKTGHWMKDECGNIICSECKRFRRDCRYGHTNYCNHCGARMEDEKE